jgi:hypothetical protein
VHPSMLPLAYCHRCCWHLRRYDRRCLFAS